MKVCHLTSVHPYNDARIFHKECVSLVEAGFEVSLVAPIDAPKLEKGVTVLPAGCWSSRLGRLLVTVPRLFLQAVKTRSDIIHFHDPELLTIAPLLRLTGAQMVYDIHEDYVTAIPQKAYVPYFLGKPLARLAGGLESLFSSWCHQVIAEKYYRDRFPHATAVLNYPIFRDQDLDPKSVDCSQFDPRWDWLLYTGNVTPDRGALNHLRCLEVSPSTAIAYIGRCPRVFAEAIWAEAQRNAIERRRIRIIGVDSFVPPETIAAYTYLGNWLAGLALFPATEHYEKKELTKFFEYMAAGIPVLASDFPAWKKVIHDNQCGVCLRPEDTQKLGQVLTTLRNEPERSQQMGARGRKAVTGKYNWQNEAAKLVRLYRDIMDEK
jgi:glycosyltransferase involved in cell wall biosynthesis